MIDNGQAIEDHRPTGLRRWAPGLGMLATYERSFLAKDLVAGIVLAAMLVPQGMAYAELAGLPAATGLYTTIACLVGYALVGPSRILVLGPDSSLSPLIFAAIVPLLAGGGPETAIALAGMLAILVGLIEIGLGVARLGFVADLLSQEVQIGYMNGLAITIIAGQLPKLFGFSTDADGFVEEVTAFFQGLDQTQVTTLLVGVGTLAVLLILPRVTRALPAVLVAVVGATLVVSVFGLADEGIDVVGTLPQGLPAPAFPWTSVADVGPLLIAALGIVLVSLTDTITLSASFAAKRGDDVDPNQEMVGVGASNIAAGLFQGFAVSASSSRTAVAETAGSKTQVTGLIGAGVVTILLVFLPWLVRNLPQTALAAVVIAAALSLADLATIRTYARIRRSALLLSLVATLGVMFLGVLPGILVAVALSILQFFRRNWWPHGEVLARTPVGWHNVRANPDGEQVDGIVVYRWEAPLFFANSGVFRQEIRRLVRTRHPRWIVLQCEAVTDVDVTAADMLERLDVELNEKGIHLAFVELRSRLGSLLLRYGLDATLDRDHFYGSIEEALDAIAQEEREAGTAALPEDRGRATGDDPP